MFAKWRSFTQTVKDTVSPHYATAVFRPLKGFVCDRSNTCLVAMWNPPNRWPQWVLETVLASPSNAQDASICNLNTSLAGMGKGWRETHKLTMM